MNTPRVTKWPVLRLRFWLWLYGLALAHIPAAQRVPTPLAPILHGPRTLRLPRGQARRFE